MNVVKKCLMMVAAIAFSSPQKICASKLLSCDNLLNSAWGAPAKRVAQPGVNYCGVMLDGFDVSKAVVRSYAKRNMVTIAYTSVGTREHWRPDADKFTGAMLSKSHDKHNERWIKPSNWRLLKPIMRERFRLFKSKGFDAVEVDNIDLMGNVKKARLNDVRDYAIWLSKTAHDLKLSIVLKNTPYLCRELVRHYDALITEQADAYRGDMRGYMYFVRAGKQWWDFEYSPVSSQKLKTKASRVYLSTRRGWKAVV
jgi:hypothetical protein